MTGTMQVSGSTVSTAAITVDLTKVSSDQSQRDGQFQNRIMQTAKFPNATFALAAPVALATVPGDGVATSAIASGQLTLHGVTKTVAVTLAIRRTGGSIAVGGSIPITFADYAIDNPSGGPATTGDAGELEFVVAFVKA